MPVTDAPLWPELPLEQWKDTAATLQLWTQIVGKVRLIQSPWINHSWHVTLYVTPRGLTTSPIPYEEASFSINFDFVGHQVIIHVSDGRSDVLPLRAESVAAFYARLMDSLRKLGVPVRIRKMPNELPDPIAFDRDETHRAYDPEYANRWWRILVQADRVFKIFRARFIGKCSPVHYFWGSADLAVTRFSGRPAPKHPGGVPYLPDSVAQEAYSHEVSSCGFWAGGGAVPYPAFYAYAYPVPTGYADARAGPAAAFYSKDFGEFILPYDAVRTSGSPDDTLLEFLQATYDAAARLGNWPDGLTRP